jgi:hypothetical protein
MMVPVSWLNTYHLELRKGDNEADQAQQPNHDDRPKTGQEHFTRTRA